MVTTDQTDQQEQEDRELARLAAEAEAAGVAANHAALERAVADLPDIPGRQEFLTLCQMARVISQSGVVPRALQGKPADVLVVLMTGRDLGIPVTAALRKVYVIDGQPSIAPQLKMALIRKRGLGRVVPHPDNDQLEDRQGAIPLGPGGYLDDDGKAHGALGPTYWYRWQDAVIAGLVRDGCTPTTHTPECNAAKGKDGVRQFNGKTANFCKDNWRKSPRRMLFQRASGFVADDYFSEASSGLYDPDELGAMLDDDGRLIDANHVELPDGFGRGHGGDDDNGAGDTVVASPEDTWAVQLRWHALPEDAHDEFRTRWKQAKIPGAPWRFPANKMKLVDATLRGVEQQWKAQGRYDPDTGPTKFAETVLAPAVAVALGVALTVPASVPSAGSPPEAPQAAPEATGQPDASTPTETDGDASGDVVGAAGGQPEPGSLPLDVPDGPADGLLAVPEGLRVASDDDKAEWAVAYVKALKLAEVDDLLRGRYGADAKGAPGDRRSRLALLVLERELGVAGAENAVD